MLVCITACDNRTEGTTITNTTFKLTKNKNNVETKFFNMKLMRKIY